MDHLFANRVVLWIADQAASNNIFLNYEEAAAIETISVTKFAASLDLLRTRRLDAILVSLPFSDCNAEELLGAIRDVRPELPVVLHELGTMRRSDADIQRLLRHLDEFYGCRGDFPNPGCESRVADITLDD